MHKPYFLKKCGDGIAKMIFLKYLLQQRELPARKWMILTQMETVEK